MGCSLLICFRKWKIRFSSLIFVFHSPLFFGFPSSCFLFRLFNEVYTYILSLASNGESKWAPSCICCALPNSSQHKAIYSMPNKNPITYGALLVCRLPGIPRILLSPHTPPLYQPANSPHFSRRRVKQKYGSEFEIKRETDSCWIIWPKRNVDATSSQIHTSTKRRERDRERGSKHSTQIELLHTEFQYLDSFPHILKKCNWIYEPGWQYVNSWIGRVKWHDCDYFFVYPSLSLSRLLVRSTIWLTWIVETDKHLVFQQQILW